MSFILKEEATELAHIHRAFIVLCSGSGGCSCGGCSCGGGGLCIIFCRRRFRLRLSGGLVWLCVLRLLALLGDLLTLECFVTEEVTNSALSTGATLGL